MAHAFMCFFGTTMGPIIYINVATPTFYDGLAVTLPPPPVDTMWVLLLRILHF